MCQIIQKSVNICRNYSNVNRGGGSYVRLCTFVFTFHSVTTARATDTLTTRAQTHSDGESLQSGEKVFQTVKRLPRLNSSRTTLGGAVSVKELSEFVDGRAGLGGELIQLEVFE